MVVKLDAGAVVVLMRKFQICIAQKCHSGFPQLIINAMGCAINPNQNSEYDLTRKILELNFLHHLERICEASADSMLMSKMF